ncbi:uncharacterized protein LOC123294764 [Chrysoperla carnea]|uniref:uncharacterized protein LOC123294764 n=1 Tax=Chrysoperla carnea TaxID=189513 RepID=UPI001D08DE0C|nr:uncharacterized protein LOC123294764 [Chrysoperla carnea]
MTLITVKSKTWIAHNPRYKFKRFKRRFSISRTPSYGITRDCNTNDVIISDSSQPSCVTLEKIHAHFHSILMQGWCYFAYDEELIFSHINICTRKEDINLTIANNLSVKVSFSQRPEIAIDDTISSIDDIKICMKTLQDTILCEGTGIPYREFASNCTGKVSINDYKRWRQNPRCPWCRSLRQRLQRKKGTDASKFKVRKVQKVIERFKKRCHRISRKTEILEHQFRIARAECAQRSEEIIRKKITELPESQQITVLTCFNEAKLKNNKMRRYDLSLVYECILFRLKSSNAYNFIRERNILPFPHQDTLNKYIQKISASAFGFQTALFDCLRTKASCMNVEDRRGILLVDEMQLASAISFDRQRMEFTGFVDLGRHIPDHQKNVARDHALVFMYVPFRGRWFNFTSTDFGMYHSYGYHSYLKR